MGQRPAILSTWRAAHRVKWATLTQARLWMPSLEWRPAVASSMLTLNFLSDSVFVHVVLFLMRLKTWYPTPSLNVYCRKWINKCKWFGYSTVCGPIFRGYALNCVQSQHHSSENMFLGYVYDSTPMCTAKDCPSTVRFRSYKTRNVNWKLFLRKQANWHE